MQDFPHAKNCEETTMYKTALWTMTFVGAAIGVFSAIMDSVGNMVVMGLIGAAFGCPLGAGLGGLLMAFKRRGRIHSSVSENEGMGEDGGMGIDPYAQMKMAQQWMDDKEQFPFHIAGDPDPVAKSTTGWKDVADVARSRDIFP